VKKSMIECVYFYSYNITYYYSYITMLLRFAVDIYLRVCYSVVRGFVHMSRNVDRNHSDLPDLDHSQACLFGPHSIYHNSQKDSHSLPILPI
jgi:hypothetical protein